jgi:hypothetical protein
MKINLASCLDLRKSGTWDFFVEAIAVNAMAWSVSLTNDSFPDRMRATAHSK